MVTNIAIPGQNGSVEKAEYCDLVEGLLLELGFKMPNRYYNLSVENQVRQYFVKEGFSEEFMKRLEPILQTGARMGLATYQGTPFENQYMVGIHATYVAALDDLADEMKQDLKDYATNLLLRNSPKNHLLRAFTGFLTKMCSFYGQYGGDMIIKDSLQLIGVSYLEAEGDKYMRFSAEAPDFAQFIRIKTGIAEAYALLAFPENMFPESEYLKSYLPAIWYMQLYLNRVNDLLSFYKEMDQEGNHNFVSNYAHSHGLSVSQSLIQLCADILDAAKRMRDIAKCDPRLQEHIETFIQGYLFFHLTLPRYRLEELDIPAVQEARKWIRG